MFLAWLEQIKLKDALLWLIELHLERLNLVHVTRAQQWPLDEEGILPKWPCPTHHASNHSVYELKTSSFKRIVIAHHLDFI